MPLYLIIDLPTLWGTQVDSGLESTDLRILTAGINLLYIKVDT